MSLGTDGSRSTADQKLPIQLVSRPNDSKSYSATVIAEGFSGSPIATMSYDRQEEGKIALCASKTSLHISHVYTTGTWRLRATPDWPSSAEGETLVTATKKKFWRRNFTLTVQGKSFVMTPTRAEERNYEVRIVSPGAIINGREVDGVLVGRLTARSKESKSYEMAFQEGLSIELIAFLFWLVNLMNKRHDTATQAALLSQF